MYEIFEKLLQEKGITSYKVAKATGISQTTFSDWKRGRSTPKTDNMQKIADYLGVTLDYLNTGVNAEPQPRIMTDQEKRIYEYAKRLLALGMTPEKLEKLVDAVEDIQK